MTSAVVPTNPTRGLALTASVRANFLATKVEIEALQASVATLQAGTFTGDLSLINASAFSWGSDLFLFRDAAGVLAQRNLTNPQEFRVYGSTTGPIYAAFGHNITDALLQTTLGHFRLSGESGKALAPTTALHNLLDLGIASSAEWRTGYFATSIVAPVASLSAGTAASAPLKIPHGVAPTSPVNGDIWTTAVSMFARINGSTVDLAATGGGGVIEPNNQIVFGTGTSVDSDTDFTYDNTSGAFFVNTVDGTTSSVSVASPGSVSIFAASHSGVGAGGDIFLKTGGGDTGGTLSLRASDGVSIAGSVSLTAGDATDPSGSPGALILAAGSSDTSGGQLLLSSGAALDVGNGGIVSIFSGAGGLTSGASGDISIFCGGATEGGGGSITIAAGDAAGTDQYGGGLFFFTGTGIGTGLPGNIIMSIGNLVRFEIDHLGSVRVGVNSPTISATDGFLYIPLIADVTNAPTGTPTDKPGFAPIVAHYDSDGPTNYRIWAYINGGWRATALA